MVVVIPDSCHHFACHRPTDTVRSPFVIALCLARLQTLTIGLSFKIIVPKLAQLLINKTDLPINEGALTNPGLDSLRLSMVSSLKVPLGLSVTLTPFPFYLFNRETTPYTPYAYINISEQHLKGNGKLAIENALAPILDETEITSFLSNFFNNQTVGLSVRGSTVAKIGALRIPLTLDKTIHISGK